MEHNIRQILCDGCGQVGIANNHLTMIEMRIVLVRQGWICDYLHDYCPECIPEKKHQLPRECPVA